MPTPDMKDATVIIEPLDPATNPAEPVQAKAVIKTWTREKAMRKGMAWWLVGWGVALFCLFIPLVHFVATPSLLLLSPIIGFAMYKLHAGKTDIDVSGASCPSCHNHLQLSTVFEKWPLSESCPHCGKSFTASINNG